MNIKIIAVIAAVAIVGGGAAWIGSSRAPAETGAAAEGVLENGAGASAEAEAEASATPFSTASLDEVMSRGGKYICTFSIKDPNTESSGTFYIKGKNVRGDFVSKIHVTGTSVESHTVIDSAYSHTWTSVSPIGYKVPVIDKGTAPASASPSAGASGSMSLSTQGANLSYQCQAGSFDDSKFVLPAGIQFMEAPAAAGAAR